MAIQVEPKVLKLLLEKYSEKFDGSPIKILAKLNSDFSSEVESYKNGDDTDVISEKTIRDFFSSKNQRSRRDKTVNRLCAVLLDGITYQEALKRFGQADSQPPLKQQINATSLEEQIEKYIKSLKLRLGIIQILGMNEPLPLSDLYIEVTFNPPESISGQQRKTINQLIDDIKEKEEATETETGDKVNLSRVNPSVERNRIKDLEVIERFSKLYVQGKPGAGKTTFLKRLALEFSGKIEGGEKLIPVYIKLKDFAEDIDSEDLIDAVIKEFKPYASDPTAIVQDLLGQNCFLILLDGLDEVRNSDSIRVCKCINRFVEQYPSNYFVVTCRTEGSDASFLGFTTVEIADFDLSQVKKFADNWFGKNPTLQEDGKLSSMADKFIVELKKRPSLKELTLNPLLLTMLCLAFKNRYAFPNNRHALYAEISDVILKLWDASRMIERDPIFGKSGVEKISRHRILDLFGEIAYNGFNQRPQKYHWDSQDLLDLIQVFIENILGVEQENLREYSEDILKGMQVRIGLLIQVAKEIYAFSHLAFQEYFTARHILYSTDTFELVNKTIDEHLLNRRWHEVFVVIAGRLKTGDQMLKHMVKIANELINREDLQKMLYWLYKVTEESGINSSSWRAFYLAVGFDVTLYIENNIKIKRSLAYKLASSLRSYNKERNEIKTRSPRSLVELSLGAIHTLASEYGSGKGASLKGVNKVVETSESLDLEKDPNIESKLKMIISTASKAGFVTLSKDLTTLQINQPKKDAPTSQWQQWADKLKLIMQKTLNIGYDVILSDESVEALENYLYVAGLILDCIQGDSYSTKKVRDTIVDSLLLPHEYIPTELLQS